MTATREVFIECDHGGHLSGCDAAWPGHPNQSIAKARADARESGWRYRGGKDLCPDHAHGR